MRKYEANWMLILKFFRLISFIGFNTPLRLRDDPFSTAFYWSGFNSDGEEITPTSGTNNVFKFLWKTIFSSKDPWHK